MTEATAGISPSRTRALLELAALFLRIGATAFGGPAAHIAMMEDEVVRRRGWLTREAFLDLVSATNLIPGPNSTELAIHIGHRRAGVAGLFVAGICFIVPAVAIVTLVGWSYVRYGALPRVAGLLVGVKPVIIAVVAQALWGFLRSAVKTTLLGGVAIAAVIAAVLGVHELLVLLGAGVVMLMTALPRRVRGSGMSLLPLLPLVPLVPSTTVVAAGATVAPVALGALFLFFLKVGSVLFGSGYVLLAFLRADLVERWHWLTEPQLLDAVAVGQLTPGPVFTTATFIGYLLGGVPSALVATVGIFLPAFVFVALSAPLVPRLRRSPMASAALDGINVASLALMALVTWHLGRSAITGWTTLGIAVVSAISLIRFRVSSAWLVLGGGLLGIAGLL